jgi:beta-glucosidase
LENKERKMMLLIGLLVFLLPFSAESVDIEALMKRMRVEDKCGQMTQVTFEVFEKRPQPTDPSEIPIDLDKLMVALRNYRLGSLQNTPYNYAAQKDTWQKIIRLIQDIALNDTALKIPILYGIDSIHGANYIREGTLFSQPLSLAATFNVDFAFKVGEITALETRAVGIPWNFNPVLDVGRQLLWSRSVKYQ